MPLPAFAAAALLKLSPIGRLLKKVPTWAWIVLAVALVLFLGWRWHNGAVRDARSEGYTAGVADERKAADAKAKIWVQRIDALTGRITTKLREKTDADARAIATRADALRLSGPGRAVCPGRAEVSRPAGGPLTAGGQGSAAGPQVPTEQWAAVPWGWLTDTGERCDLNRNEVLAWREWHRQQSEAWAKAVKP